MILPLVFLCGLGFTLGLIWDPWRAACELKKMECLEQAVRVHTALSERQRAHDEALMSGLELVQRLNDLNREFPLPPVGEKERAVERMLTGRIPPPPWP